MRATSLYITYDGLLEPLGQTQVLPYVEGLAETGIGFVLLSFEKPADLRRGADVARLRARLDGRGIRWVALRYHKRPSVPATAWDVAQGAFVAAWLACRHRARVVHCRSYVPALMGLPACAVSGARLLFDMRGFWPEERVEGGLWSATGAVFRAAKRVERMLLAGSDAVIVLTDRARAVLERGAYRAALAPKATVTVIPCCVDLAKFASTNVWEPPGAASGPRTLVYAGSVGTWYMLAEMLEFFRVARRHDPELRFLILNRGAHDEIHRAVAAAGIDGVTVAAATPDEVPAHLAATWAGIYFIRPVFSKSGASPTKLGEYLAAGLPVVVNAGVGDADAMVAAANAGVVVERFTADEYAEKWEALTAMAADPALRRRCREAARRELALDAGVARYRHVYDSLLGAPAGRPAGSGGGHWERDAPRVH